MSILTYIASDVLLAKVEADDWKKDKVHTSHINAEQLNFEMLQAFFNNALSQHCIVIGK